MEVVLLSTVPGMSMIFEDVLHLVYVHECCERLQLKVD